MAIVYESAAPIALAGNIYSQAAQRAAEDRQAQINASQASRGSGGGGNNAYVMPTLDTGIQDAVNQRDRLQFQRESSYLQRDDQTLDRFARADLQTQQLAAADARQRQQEMAEKAQMEQRFRLQAELQQTELTQQEKMRLQRMKNAVGEVSNDPSLADDEKAAIITQLRTGINPLEQRLAKQRISAVEQEKNQLAERHQAAAALDNQRLKVMSATADQRQVFYPDPQALADITADITDSFGAMARFVPENKIAEMAKQEAIKQGLGQHGVIQPDGKIEFTKEASGPGGRAGGKPGVAATPTGYTEDKFIATYNAVIKEIDARARATQTGPDGFSKVPAEPDLHGSTTEENDAKRGKAVAARMEALTGYPDITKFRNALVVPEQGGGPKRFDPNRASYRKGRVAAAASETPGRTSDGSPEPGGTVGPSAIGKLEVAKDRIAKAAGVSPADKARAVAILDESRKLAAAQTEKDPAKWPTDVRKRIEELGREYGAIAAQIPPEPEPAAPPQPQPAAAPPARGREHTASPYVRQPW